MVHRILVVDDELNMLALLKRVLCKEGYRIECAQSGKAGLRIAKEGRFALAIVDVSMPDMDGIDLLRQLKSISTGMPVIMISALPSWETERQARELACTHWLSKPLDMRQLKEIIRTILNP